MKFTRYLLLLFTIFAMSMSHQVLAQDNDDDDEDEGPEEAGCPWNCPDGEENGWCWGKNPDMSKEKNVIYNDMMTMKDYKNAIPALEWLLTNTPNLNKAIYINGEKIYRALEESSEGEEQKMYQDKVLKLLDQRIEYFCEGKKILQKKGQLAYSYLYPRRKDDKAYYDTLYQLYEKIYEVAGNETKRSNMTYYMLMTNVVYQLKKVDDDKVMEIYDKLSESLDHNIEGKKAEPKKQAKWVKTKDAVDALFEKTLDGKINCEFVKERWGSRIQNDKDIKLAKKALRFMIKDKCTDDPLFLTVVEIIHKDEPNVGTAVILYKKYLAAGDETTAYKYIEDALGLAKEDPSKQAEIYEDRAGLKNKANKWSEARTDYLKAIELDASRANDIYTKIGNMYYGSFKACLADGGDPVKDRAVYFAAYDMYAKAGDNSGMAKARAQFPTKADIFTYAAKGYQEGGSIGIGCWIGGSSTIRAR